MKLPSVVNKLFKNKYVYYALMVLAAVNVLGYVSVKAWECVVLFAVTAYGVKMMSKNLTLALLAAMFAANYLFGCGRVKEGMEDAMKSDEDKLAEASEKVDEVIDNLDEKVKCEEGEEYNEEKGKCEKVKEDAENAKNAIEIAREAASKLLDE
ncbi:MAG: hypothetical protein CBB97_21160 [Candidatus Endolissoclinum sp. TMED37]|nr:MAG: hypothetical protein CBB97_21160 [Candidatus Endolissoclinum sp. TMED37]